MTRADIGPVSGRGENENEVETGMEAAKIIGWFVALVFSTQMVFWLIGFSGLTNMPPEGRRWWHLPAQYAALALFAAVVLLNPWRG